MEAPQGVESTGTNRPSDLNTHTTLFVWATHAFTMRFPEHDREPPTPQPPNTNPGGQGGRYVFTLNVSVVIAVGETPGPIPNPEVKPTSADGTAPETVWESRTPPDTNI
jgi:hypothetical protein